MKTLREMDTKKLLVTFFVALTAGLVVFGTPPDSQAQVTISNVNVAIGPTSFALWSSQTLNAGQSLVLTQNPPATPTPAFNFDSSDSNGYTGGNAVVSGTATGAGCSNFSFNDTNHVLTVANADHGGFAFNEAQDYSQIGSFTCGGLVITVSVGYADNAHSDACGSDATANGLHGSSSCQPSNGPFATADFFQGSGQLAPSGYPGTSGPHSPCSATSPSCFDSGVILFTATNGTTPPPCQFGLTIANTSWNSFNVPSGKSAVVWLHAHIGTPSGIPTNTTTQVNFTNGTFTLTNGSGTSTFSLPNGVMNFVPGSGAPTTTYNMGTNTWTTTVDPNQLSDELFFDGDAIPVTAALTQGGKATVSFTVQSADTNLAFNWQWSAAVYAAASNPWPADWNQAMILAYHHSDHAGTPENKTIQAELIQGPRGGGGSNFTGSWSATGNGSCK